MGREEVRRGGGHGQEEELLTPQVDSHLAIALAPADLRGSLAFGNCHIAVPCPGHCVPGFWPLTQALHLRGPVTPAGVPLERSPFETA